MPALDFHVSGLAGRRPGQRRGAVCLRRIGTAARLRAAAGRRDGCCLVAPRSSRCTHSIQPMASKSAAVLLGDLCLIWAEQMLRECGIDHRRLQQAWPRYDAMRTELALGQFADLASDIRDLPSMDTVLEVARRKSGNYTVRRPLEIGAAMSGCSDRTVSGLGRYGEAVGEAFQLRDDLLGVFGAETVTGKPSGQDLIERKATSVVIAAHELSDPPTRRQLTALMNTGDLDDNAIERWRTLIVTTGAVQRIEDMISSRVSSALNELDDLRIGEPVRAGLAHMAAVCTERTE